MRNLFLTLILISFSLCGCSFFKHIENPIEKQSEIGDAYYYRYPSPFPEKVPEFPEPPSIEIPAIPERLPYEEDEELDKKKEKPDFIC